MLKQIKMWKKKKEEKQKKLELAALQHKYLIDTVADIPFLKKCIELVNTDPELIVDMILTDGTKLTIRRPQTRQHTSNAYLFNGEE